MASKLVTTQNDIIRDAFALLNIYGASESIDGNDYEFAKRFLNRMIKTWMSQGYHLWLKETITLFLQKGQNTYYISSDSDDHATLAYITSYVAEEADPGSDTIELTSVEGLTAGDYVGIMQEDQTLHWSVIDSVNGIDSTITIDDDLTDTVLENAIVYTYTEKYGNPLDVYSGVRNQDGIDVPMNELSYEEYFYLPDKEYTKAVPISFNYDKQLSAAVIRIWNTPASAIPKMKLTVSRRIENMDFNSSNPDFPDEWVEAIVYGLAVRIAPAFSKHKDAGFQSLVTLASEFLTNAASFDEEMGSIYLKPDMKYA